MKKYKQIMLRRLILSMITNPVFIMVYWISFYELYALCQYGEMYKSISILLICMLFFLASFIILIVRMTKKTITIPQQIIDEYVFYDNGIKFFQNQELRVEFKEIKLFSLNRKYCLIVLKNKEILVLDMTSKTDEEINIVKYILKTSVKCNRIFKVIRTYISILIIVLIALFYGVKIYHSAINYNGKLSWFINDLENKRTIKFEHKNIYENGIEGIFIDINKEIKMAKDLYVSGNFNLNFDSNGIITSFDTYLYGKNDNGTLESYLIIYDSNRSNKITINVNGYVNGDYKEDDSLEPLINTLKVIPLKETVSRWNENMYSIIYYGKRNFGYNTDGIVYVNLKGDIKPASKTHSEISGYAVSVFVPNKETEYTPVRYILAMDLDNVKATDSQETNEREKTSKQFNNADEFYLSDKIGYRLNITGAAAGSRSYSLFSTKDSGVTWNSINKDPFLGRSGVASGITFLNEKLGFLCLSNSGARKGELYRTEDGGLSYKKVEIPTANVATNTGEMYNPFDLPEMPYMEDGKFNILIGQGSDGDYNGGCKALYQSDDHGVTWKYIKEVTNN